jgi:hypothetical protein
MFLEFIGESITLFFFCVFIKYLIYITVYLRNQRRNRNALHTLARREEVVAAEALSVGSVEENEAEDLLNEEKQIAAEQNVPLLPGEIEMADFSKAYEGYDDNEKSNEAH